MHSRRTPFRKLRIALNVLPAMFLAVACTTIFFAPASATALNNSSTVATQSDSQDLQEPATRGSIRLADGPAVSLVAGFEGTIKLGHFCPVHIRFEQAEDLPDRFEIFCRDGDDTPVSYRGRLQFDQSGTLATAGFRPGRGSGNFTIRLLRGSETVQEIPVPFSGGVVETIASTRPLILVVGDEQPLVSLIEDSLIADADLEPVILQTSADHLPANARGYEGVQSLVLVAGSEIPEEKCEPVQSWLAAGGDIILLTRDSEEFATGIRSLVPASINGVQQTDGSETGRSLKTETPLVEDDQTTVPICIVENIQGIVELKEGRLPVIIRSASGFGQTSMVTLNLASEALLQWPGTRSLIRQLFNRMSGRMKSDRASGSSVLNSGYEDIAGQLRGPLDRFQDVRFVSFTLVALLIALVILCVGPGDFFLLKKVIGKMELTWITLGLMTLGFCGLAWAAHRYTKPSNYRINQVEIIDIRAADSFASGTVWSNLYTPDTTEATITTSPTSALGFEIDSSLLLWHGLPGNGLGGMQNAGSPALNQPAYHIDLDQPNNELSGMPFRVASSRPLFGRWQADSGLEILHDLTFDLENVATAQLEGTLTNPFESNRLMNCRIFYRDWVYVLPKPLEAGETIAVGAGDTNEKSVENYFARRVADDSKGYTTAWDPSDSDLVRITDVMMFYGLAGGRAFTGLTHHYQTHFDFSHLPRLEQAVLTGEIELAPTPILIDGETDPDTYDKKLTIVRIVIPVDTSGD